MSDEQASTGTPKKRKKWPVVLAVLILLPILLVLALPTILSSSFARGKVLAKVNESAPGTVAIDDWSLSWFGENTVSGLSYVDEAGAKLADVKQVVIEKGLLDLARDQENIGVVRVEQPVITYTLPETKPQPASSPKPSEGSKPAASTPRPPVEPKPAAEPPRIPVNAVLQILDGSVNVQLPGTTEALDLHALNTEIAVEKATSSVAVDLKSAVGAADAPLEVKAAIKPLSGDTLEPENLSVQGTFSAKELALGPFLAIAQAFSEAAPSGEGQLTSFVKFDLQGLHTINAEGSIDALGLKLQGGALTTDRPDLGNIALKFKATSKDGGLSFRDTEIESRFVKATVQGDLPKGGDGSVSVNGKVDLAALAGELPATLKLQEGLVLNSGGLRLAAELKQVGEFKTLGTTVVIDNVAGQINGKDVALAQPVQLQFAGALQGEEVNVQDLKIRSSFLQAEGSGSLDNLSVSANASLEKALAEVSQFVDLGEWQATGDLALNLSVEKQREKERKLVLKVVSSALRLSQGAKELLPEQPVTLDATALTDIPDKGFLTQVYKLESSFNTSIAAGKLNLFNLVLPEPQPKGAKKALPRVETVSLNASINLEELNKLLPPPTNGPPMKLLGTATLAGAGSLTDAGIETKVMSLGLSEFYLEQGPKSVYQRRASVQTRMLIQLDKKQVQLNEVVGKFAVGEVRADQIALKDWTDVINTLDAAISTRFDLMQVSKELAKWTAADEPLPMGGTADLSVIAKPGAKFDVDAKLTDFAWKLSNQQLVTDSNLQFKVKAAIDDKANAVSLTGLTLSSTPLTLNGDASFKGASKTANGALEAKGTMAYDMQAMGEYIKMFSGQELNARGKAEKPFNLRVPIADAASGQKAPPPYFNSSFFVESMEFYGLSIRQLDVPILLEENLLQASLEARINQGHMALYPSINLADELPMLTVPTNSMVLDKVDLTDSLANELLGKIHPLFKGAAVATGKVSVVLAELAVPTAGDVKNGMVLKGELQLQEVRLASSGLLGTVLKLAKVKEQAHDLGDENIAFECRNGRIHTSPLQFEVDGIELTFEGSMGLDQTLDYRVKVPVTKKIIDERYAEYLEGEYISLPIAGTASRPRIAPNALQEALKPLVAKAAKKAAGDILNEKAGKLLEGLLK